jgi:catechol 2,3-dioxygenase-like lactoylglutathione lyase family enzyme
MKTHMSLHATNLDESVRFYSTLLGAAPLKHYPDYALFVTSEPGLELALNATSGQPPPNDVHYGVAVDSSDAVDAAIERFANAGIAVDVETEETCCYAKQNKVWARDPDGRRWETYVVLEEVEPESARACCR